MAKPKTSKQFAAKIKSLKGEIAKLEKGKKATAAAKRKAPKKRKAPAKKRKSPKKRKR